MNPPHRAAWWPRSVAHLTDITLCPACFTPLTSLRCAECALDLTHPDAAQLLVTSQQAAQLLTDRATLIEGMWADRAARIIAEVPLSPSLAVASSAPTSGQVASDRPSDTSSPSAPDHPTSAVEEHPARPQPRRSGVQIALLAVGVSLLSIFAIFFLIYAFITFGLVFRSLVIAAITAATFTAASMLRRRNLTSSAEGIAVFAVILSYLDAYAIRSNDLMGAGDSDPAFYAGAVAVILSAAFVAWHRISGLRTPRIVGWATLAPGAGMLVVGALPDAAGAAQLTLGSLAVALVSAAQLSIVPRTAAPRGVRYLPTLIGSASVLIGSVGSLGLDDEWVASAFAACGAVALLLSAALVHHPALRAASKDEAAETDQAIRSSAHLFEKGSAVALAAWAGGVFSLTGVVWAFVTPGQTEGVTVLVAVAGAVASALIADIAVRRLRRRPIRVLAIAALWATSIGLIGGTLPLLAHTIRPLLSLVVHTLLFPWLTPLTEPLTEAHPDLPLMLGGTALIILLATVLWASLGTLRERTPLLGWVVLGITTLAIGALPALWMVLAGWSLLAVATLTLLRLAPTRLTPLRTALATTLVASTLLLVICGWASTDSWAGAVALTVALLSAARPLVDPTGKALLRAGQALALPLVSWAFAMQYAWPSAVPATTVTTNAALLLAMSGSALVAFAAVISTHRIALVERHTMFWVGALSTGGALVAVFFANDTPAHPAHLVPPQHAAWLIGAATVISFLVWLWRAPHSVPERLAAALPLASAVAATLSAVAVAGNYPLFVVEVIPAVAALMVAVLALGTAQQWATRVPLDAGAALVLTGAVIWVAVTDPRYGWVALLFAAVATLILSISPDGLIRSRNRRKYAGWVALVLAVAALWTGLGTHPAHALEAYLLPVSGMLLLVAVAFWNAERRHDASPYAAPAALAAALTISLVPLSITAVDSSFMRATTIYALGIALLAVGLCIPQKLRLYRYGVQAAALLTILIIGVGRALTVWPDSLEIDGWACVTSAVIAGAAYAHRRQGSARGALLLGALAMSALFVSECAHLHPTGMGETRAHILTWGFSATALILHQAQSIRLARVSLGYGALIGALSVWTGATQIVEMATVPLAIALLIMGARTLANSPSVRSLTTLGPGLLMLMLPTLLSTTVLSASTPAPLWRLVGLGVVAIAVLLVGLTRKLQAPFLIGAAVTLIHAITTFAPQIRAVYESQQWWLWVGLGGILLVTLAIRYESGIRTLKRAAHSIGELR